MSRPKGKRNTRPTKAEIGGYFALLRNAADSGDVSAAAELIKIDHLTRQDRQVETKGAAR